MLCFFLFSQERSIVLPPFCWHVGTQLQLHVGADAMNSVKTSFRCLPPQCWPWGGFTSPVDSQTDEKKVLGTTPKISMIFPATSMASAGISQLVTSDYQKVYIYILLYIIIHIYIYILHASKSPPILEVNFLIIHRRPLKSFKEWHILYIYVIIC